MDKRLCIICVKGANITNKKFCEEHKDKRNLLNRILTKSLMEEI